LPVIIDFGSVGLRLRCDAAVVGFRPVGREVAAFLPAGMVMRVAAVWKVANGSGSGIYQRRAARRRGRGDDVSVSQLVAQSTSAPAMHVLINESRPEQCGPGQRWSGART
jgi:hypothetical protein